MGQLKHLTLIWRFKIGQGLHSSYICKMKKERLFVYGSLMGGIQSPIATYLKSNSIFLGEGKVNGILLDIGHYPGLVYEPQSKKSVLGHVFELNNATTMLPNLDHYECVGLTFESPNQYRRESIQVLLDKEKISCWAYLYNLPIAGIKVIESGNYLAYFEQNEAYQKFVSSLNNFDRPI